jgi:hypothetical protein
MPIVQPPKERHSIQDEGTSLRVTVPSRRNYFTMFFLGFWLAGWAFGEIMVGGILIAGITKLLFNTPELDKFGVAGFPWVGLFLLVWLGGWTLGGGFALYNFLWQLAGKENIEISNDSIRIQRAIFGLGRTKEYLTNYIKNLRVSPGVMDNNMFGWPRTSSFWANSGGYLAFDYGSQTFRFGGGIDEAEARQILEKIIGRFPQFRPRER